MQAVILAAGMGKRLKEHTREKTKCMVNVGGQTIIERGLRILDTEGLSRIIVVTGYKSEGLMAHVDSLGLSTPVVYVHNSEYENTSNLYSLSLAEEYLKEDDTIFIESDIVYERAVVERMLDSDEECLTFVSKPKPWMDGSIVTLGKDGYINDFIGADNFAFQNMDSYYKTVSMYKLSKEYLNKVYLPLLVAYVKAWGNKTHYESALKVVAFKEQRVLKALVLEN